MQSDEIHIDGVQVQKEPPFADLPSARGEWSTQVPTLLASLTAESRMVREVALGRLTAEILREGRVFPLTAAVVPHLLPLLTHEGADRLPLAQLLLECGLAARTWSAHVAYVHPSHRDGSLGTLHAIRQGYPHIQACYRASSQDAALVEVLCGLWMIAVPKGGSV